jgi:hypothetical protein
MIAVAIDHERGEEIGFAVDHAVGIAIADHGATVLFGGAETAQKEIAADLFDLPRQHAERDLGAGAEMGGAERMAAGVGDLDRFTGLSAAAIDNVAGKDPRVAARDPIGSLAVDANFVHRIS